MTDVMRDAKDIAALTRDGKKGAKEKPVKPTLPTLLSAESPRLRSAALAGFTLVAHARPIRTGEGSGRHPRRVWQAGNSCPNSGSRSRRYLAGRKRADPGGANHVHCRSRHDLLRGADTFRELRHWREDRSRAFAIIHAAVLNSRAGLRSLAAIPVFVYVVVWIEGRGNFLDTPYRSIVFGAFLLTLHKADLGNMFCQYLFAPNSVARTRGYCRPLQWCGCVLRIYRSARWSSRASYCWSLGALPLSSARLLNATTTGLSGRFRVSRSSSYLVPRGGLFRWVASPHYVGEIFSFLGYAMLSDLLPVWGTALAASAYLSARANSTLEWYRREMPLRISPGWRRLVPFINGRPLPAAPQLQNSRNQRGQPRFWPADWTG